MASYFSFLEEKLKCNICSKTFEEPVVLGCSHSVCKACLEGPCNQKSMKDCPICQKKSKHSASISSTLKDVCEFFVEEKKRRISAENNGTVCEIHSLKHELFSTGDQKLLCSSCLSQNYPHQFSTISKAAEEHRKKIESPLQKLEGKMQDLISVQSIFSKMMTALEFLSQQTETQLNKEFQKLYQFLKVELEARLSALRDEQKRKKERIMGKIAGAEALKKSLAEQIQSIKNYVAGDDSVFLQYFKSIEDRTNFTETIPQLDSECLLDRTKHIGNVKFQVWKKMKDICPYYTTFLDPNTQRGSLQVSPDLTSITCVPGPAANSAVKSSEKSLFSIVGSEGFSSGLHTWQVEVEACEHWALGVITECAKKTRNPNSNFLISQINGKSSWNPPALKVKKVCVHLDMDKGQVVFTDPDTNTTLKSYTHKFTEKMYPLYFLLGKFPLKILPSMVSVSV